MAWSRRRVALVVFAVLFATAMVLSRTVPRRGRVRNDSQHLLRVVETDVGRAREHLLRPGEVSPPEVDADGLRAEDGSPIDGHQSWWKVRDVSVAVVSEQDGQLHVSCLLCSRVQDDEFGTVWPTGRAPWGVAPEGH